jgi:hypothetical protein
LRLFAVSLSAAAMAFAPAAYAQPTAGPASDDAKCLLEMVVLSNSSAPEAQRAGEAGIVFFVGRISVRDPNFDFARLKTMAQALNPQTAQTDLQQRCGPMVQSNMQRLEAALGAPPAQSAPSAPTPPKAH